MDPAIVMCKNSGHGEDGEKIMELETMDMDGSATEKMDNGDDGREGDEGTRLKKNAVVKLGFFGSSNLTADPDAVSMIQTASHLSPDAVGNIQTGSLESGLESSSIFIPVSYLVRFLLKLSPNHVYFHQMSSKC
ncbi:hypothetical protein Tco_0944317 [Tanacetum coccineum]